MFRRKTDEERRHRESMAVQRGALWWGRFGAIATLLGVVVAVVGVVVAVRALVAGIGSPDVTSPPTSAVPAATQAGETSEVDTTESVAPTEATGNTEPTEAVTFTEVHVYSAFGVGMKPSSHFTDVHAGDSGACWTASQVFPRGDSYRCKSGSLILDPCFAGINQPPSVVCVGAPWDSAPIILTLKADLPDLGTEESEATAGEPPLTWAVVLGDKVRSRCLFFGGAGADYASERVNFFCEPAGFIRGFPRQRGNLWIADFIPDESSVQTIEVPIAEAWR